MSVEVIGVRCSACEQILIPDKMGRNKRFLWETNVQQHHAEEGHLEDLSYVCPQKKCFLAFATSEEYRDHRLDCLRRGKNAQLSLADLFAKGRLLITKDDYERQLMEFQNGNHSWRDWDAKNKIKFMENNTQVNILFLK